MGGLARLVIVVGVLGALVGLLLAPTTAQPQPAFLAEVRKAVVFMGSYGVLTSPERILSIQHGSLGQTEPGTEITVSFRGLWEALHPEQARGMSIPPAEFVRKGRFLCAFEDVDVSWVHILGPAPEGANPVTLSRNITPRVFILLVLRGAPSVVSASFTGQHLGGFPLLQVHGATVVDGWSGSPVVNARGEVIGLIRGGDLDQAIVAGPVRMCHP